MFGLPEIEPPASFGWRADPRTASLPLMNAWECLALIGGYLAFVYLGPVLMRPFAPFDLKPLRVLYNAFMVLLSGYMFFELTYNTVFALGHGWHMWSLPIDRSPAGDRIARALYLFYVSKPIEFVDTLFIVLRKKNTQLSFLHVYHHATIFAMWFVNVRYFPGGDAWFAAAFNAFVHVLMYTYYLVTTLGGSVPFKSLLTLFQILQFVSFVCQGVYGLAVINPAYGLEIMSINMAYACSLLYLFVQFFRSSYAKQPRAGAGKGRAKASESSKDD